MENVPSVRIDKWVWAVRLARTRSLAAKDCGSGRIKRLDPVRKELKSLKASASIKVGDVLEIPSPDGTHQRTVIVKELLEKRVGAPLARLAYDDETPAEILTEAAEKKKILREDRLHRQEGDQGRMTKRKRREWNKGLHTSNPEEES